MSMLDKLDPTAIAGGIISGVGSYFSGKQAAAQAERMYKHRYRWQMQDLKAAGLNPMLTVSQGAGNPSVPDVPNVGESAVRGYTSAKAVSLQSRLNEAQISNINAQTAASNATAAKTAMETKILGHSEPFAAQQAEYLRDKAGFEVSRLQEEIEVLRKQQDLQDIDIRSVKPLLVQYQKLQNRAAELGLSEAAADAALWDMLGKWGKLAEVLAEWIPGIGSFLPKSKGPKGPR